MLKNISHGASIAEIFISVRDQFIDKISENLRGVGVEAVRIFRAGVFKNLEKFFAAVVMKLNVLVETRGKTRIRRNKFFHKLRIARNDNNQIVPIIFHKFQQGINRLLPVIVIVCEGICFVNEKHAADRLTDNFLCLEGGLTEIACDHSRTIRFD